jgi:thiol-disulfide isomerase/thioredoxin
MDSPEASAVDPTPRDAPKPERWRSARRTVLEVIAFVGMFIAILAYQERNLLSKHALAPGFSLESLDGRTVSLEDYRGKRVLVHFWATWCGVCRQELSALNAVERDLGPDEALLTVVADSGDPAQVRDFVSKEGIRYPVLLADSATLRAYRIGMFPTNYFLDAEGRISGHTVGMSTRWSFRARLALAR